MPVCLFFFIVKFVLLNGSEVWGYDHENLNCLEGSHLEYLKHVLKLSVPPHDTCTWFIANRPFSCSYYGMQYNDFIMGIFQVQKI